MKKKSSVALYCIALFVLSVTFFGIGPGLSQMDEALGHWSYILIRITTYFLFGLFLKSTPGATITRLLSMVGSLLFVEHFLFRIFDLWKDVQSNPAAWDATNTGKVLLGLGMTYITFYPVLAFIAYFGFFSGKSPSRPQ